MSVIYHGHAVWQPLRDAVGPGPGDLQLETMINFATLHPGETATAEGVAVRWDSREGAYEVVRPGATG